jgi:hypothetical protein
MKQARRLKIVRSGTWRRVTGSFWIRLAVSLALLGAVLSQIDLPAAAIRLEQGRWWLFAAATAIFVAALLVGVVRWRFFLDAAATPASARKARQAYFAGAFANNVLPANLAGDVVRAWIAGGPGRRVRAGATVVVDRVTLLGCALLLGWLAALATMPPDGLIAALAVSSAVYAALVLAIPLATRLLGPRLRRRFSPRLAQIGEEGIVAARSSLSSRRLAIKTTVLGLAYEALAVLALWLAARSVEVPLSVWAMAVILPPLLLLSSLPVSIGGFGVREISFVALLAPLGVNATDATLVALIGQAAFVLATLPGAFVLLHRRRT